MTTLVPKRMFLTKGIGWHKEELRSFEMALRSAGIEKFNLVNVSSILPPGCRIIRREEGFKDIIPGQMTYCVMARCSTNEPRRKLAASIGVAVPRDKRTYGYISEHHAFGQSKREAGDYAEDLAAAMLATTLGIEFDEDSSWDEKEEVFRLSGKIVRTQNITSVAVNKPGGYTTVIAAAIFVMDD